MKKILIGLVIFMSVQSSFAQTSTTSARRSIATVMFAGLGGAILGLSTLSFYGEPQDHIGNIWTGLVIGALAGGGYLMSQSYRQPVEAFVQPSNPNQMKLASRSLFKYQFEF